MSGAPEPGVVDLPAATTAVIGGTIPMSELAAFFDRAFSTLAAVVGEQQIAIVGPAFAYYLAPPTDTAELEVGFPTDRPVEPSGDVRPSSLPEGRVARVVHHGGYDGLGAAWAGLGAWAGEHGHAPGAGFWEVYVTEPSPDMDPADLRTELYLPLA